MTAASAELRLTSCAAPDGRAGLEQGVLALARLDRCLARLARRPERFRRHSDRLAAALDVRGIDLEIADPNTWRSATKAPRVPLERQFRAEVGCLRPLVREEELRLALRIEFARLRLERGLELHGLRSDADCDCAALPAVLLRRRQEWHALRLEMVERNLYLVLLRVERYRGVRVERSDLIQAAAAALFPAVDKFDWRRGVLFRTYAVHWLNLGFLTHVYQHSRAVRVPLHAQKAGRQVRAALQRLGDPRASIEEIAREAGLRTSAVAAVRRREFRVCSLDAALYPYGGTRTLADDLARPEDEDARGFDLEEASIESGIAAALAQLNPRARHVVELRFGIGCPRQHCYSEIAAELGVSMERARQIAVQALSRLRSARLRRVFERMVG